MTNGQVPRVAVVGSGYVGTVVASCLAWLGREVTVVEVDDDKRAQLSAGHAPFFEPRLPDLLAEARVSGRLSFTSDVSEALDASDVLFLCVGTPAGLDGHADTSAVLAAATAIGSNLRTPHVIVTKSTVPIGSGHWLESAVEDSYSGDLPLDDLLSVVSCPEFLREGSAVDDFLHPERVVLGSDDPRAIDTVVAVYQPILEQSFAEGNSRPPTLVRTGLSSAETAKYAANAFLATKISFINEIARICELVGADVTDVAHAIGLDTRIGERFLDAGVGWGGSCFGKDLAELVSTAVDYGHDPALLRATIEVNERQRHVVVEKLRAHLKTLRGKRICLLGLAFKAGTDDLRDAPAIDIARWLLRAGALVTAHDPQVDTVPALSDLRLRPSALDAARGADAVVVLTEWPEYRALDLVTLRSVMRGSVLIDGRNLYDPIEASLLGFDHDGIGRGENARRDTRARAESGGIGDHRSAGKKDRAWDKFESTASSSR